MKAGHFSNTLTSAIILGSYTKHSWRFTHFRSLHGQVGISEGM